jgi:hypothetical protein
VGGSHDLDPDTGQDVAASAEMAAAAVRSAAAGAVELPDAKATGGMAQALAKDGADRAADARGADPGPPGRIAPAATQCATAAAGDASGIQSCAAQVIQAKEVGPRARAPKGHAIWLEG